MKSWINGCLLYTSEFTGTVTDTLNAEVCSGDATFELYQAPAKSMDVSVGSGDVRCV